MIGEKAGVIVDEGNSRTGAPKKYASAHDLRCTFAQRLIDSDLQPRLVRTLMRHADIRTTERYYLKKNTQRDAGKIRDALQPKPAKKSSRKSVPKKPGYSSAAESLQIKYTPEDSNL